MNRGIARRTVFEDRASVRYFQSRLAWAVRRAEFEVHAYTVLTTHFHLLVRSPTARLSEGMRRAQNEYVRWFNRRNQRDGPLFRGRFLSRRVDALRYRRILVRYIDQNAPKAGLADSPESYAHGSAERYARSEGPRWLSRGWVESDAMSRTGESRFSWSVYRMAFGAPVLEDECELVERRLDHTALEPDPLDDLVGAAPEAAQAWMRRKALRADSSLPGLPCAVPARIARDCRRERLQRPNWSVRRGRRNDVNLWTVLEVALLRDLAGLRWQEVAQRMTISPSGAKRLYEVHRLELGQGGEYQRVASRLAFSCLDQALDSCLPPYSVAGSGCLE